MSNQFSYANGSDTKAGTTVFHTDDRTVVGSKLKHSINDYIPVTEQSISDFLAKPVLINQTLWSTGNAQNTKLYTLSTVNSLLLSGYNNGYYFNKIQGFNLIRFTACFRLVLNCNPFQAGKLIASFSPLDNLYTVPNHRQFMLSQQSALPHVIVDCRDGTGILKIPYHAPSGFYDIKAANYDWGRFTLAVLLPLVTGAAGETTADISTYFWMEDVELAAPTVPQMNAKSKPRKRIVSRVSDAHEEHEAAEGGAISQITSAATGIFESIGETIPALSAYTKPAAWLSETIGGVASIFGWSKPRNEVNPTPVFTQREPFTANATGICNSASLALTHNNSLELLDDIGPEEYDEMSFEYLKRRYQFVQTWTWNASDAAGTAISSYDVRPTKMYEEQSSTVYSAHYMNMRNYVPFAHVARYFGYYRGGIKFKICFAKTEFHTGRLMFTWTPTYNYAVTPNINTSVLSLREIVDIKGKREVEFTLPYLLNSPWAKFDISMGQLDVTVLNILRCPETASQSIQMAIFACAADDFQLAGPTGMTVKQVCVPQMDTGTPVVEQPSKIYEVLGGQPIRVSDENIVHNTKTFGEVFTSIKQLLLRYAPISYSDAPTITTGYEINPYYSSCPTINTGTGAMVNPTVGWTPYQDIAAGYLFHRGSMRLLVPSPNVASAGAYYRFTNNTTVRNINGSVSKAQALTQTNLTYSSSISDLPIAQFDYPVGGQAQALSVTAPYYNAFYRHMHDPSSSVNAVGTTVPKMVVGFNFTNSSNIFQAVGDDYQMGYFIGFLPTIETYI